MRVLRARALGLGLRHLKPEIERPGSSPGISNLKFQISNGGAQSPPIASRLQQQKVASPWALRGRFVVVHASVFFLAAHSTTLDRLRHIPTSSWVNLAIFVISVVVVYKMWHTLRAVNDYAPYLACGVVATCVFFYWVYTRTEPSFLTPVVERMAPFFPSRAQQQDAVDRAKTHRDS